MDEAERIRYSELVHRIPMGAICVYSTGVILNDQARQILESHEVNIRSTADWRDLVESGPGEWIRGGVRLLELSMDGGRTKAIEARRSEWNECELWLLEDVTRTRAAEAALRQREAELGAVFESASQGIVLVDRKGRIRLANSRMESLFGYSREEMVGAEIELLVPGRWAEVHRRHRTLYFDHPSVRPMGLGIELTARRKDGSEFPVEIGLSHVESPTGMLAMGLITDISQRKAAERRETLFKEIHHRVKNNLQVVSSLLGLQARGTPDLEVRRMFQESQNRVHSMALLHEVLYQGGDFAEIDCADYLRRLSGNLFRSYGVSSSRVTIRIDADGVHLPLDTAVPCGLIVNELVSNSLKYAFPNDRQGKIEIRLAALPEGYEMTVADDGIGLPEDINLWKTSSLGLRLVRTLAGQINASLDFSGGHGTSATLRFQVIRP